MKQASRKKLSRKLSFHFHQRLREGLLIVTVAISLFLLMALLTYHSTDPGWSNTGETNAIANAGGRVGAWMADVFLYICGYVAYLFPLMLSYAAWQLVRHRQMDASSRYLSIVRSVGFILVLLAGAGITSLHFPLIQSHLPYTSGGVLGNLIGFSMVKVFNPLGSYLILVALFLSGVTWFSGLSWVRLADHTGRIASDALNRCWDFYQSKKTQRHSRDREYEEDLEVIADKPPVRPKIVRSEPKVKIENEESVNKPKSVPPVIVSKKEEQPVLFEAVLEGTLPPLTLLDVPDRSTNKGYTNAQLEMMSREVELKLQDFGIDAKVVAVHPGPVVTRFELELAAGTKVSRINALVKDLARSLSVISVRIVEVIPGKSVIGLELPNQYREIVRLREVLSSQLYDNARSPLTLALGKDIAGHPVMVDLAKMPHLLVAGTTGSGKSVGLNAMLLSMLYKATPVELRLILIDPKMLELAIYDGVPHLLTPVVTDMKEAASALRWCVIEMDRRYKLMASLGVRNIVGYNHKVKEAKRKGSPLLDPLWKQDTGTEQQPLEELPYIVVLADEFADLMMVAGKKVEELIARLAQKARAAGIHLILATQRPSVDVITGLIKANIPTRIAFQVSSKVDSRTILDQQGAEQLLGHGDMLYLAPGAGIPVRIHGAFVADEEVHRVVNDLKRRGRPDYLEDILSGGESLLGGDVEEGEGDGEKDSLYDQAVFIVTETRRASISSIQRRLKIGFNRAARIIEAMEAAGVVGPMESNGSREVLAPPPND